MALGDTVSEDYDDDDQGDTDQDDDDEDEEGAFGGAGSSQDYEAAGLPSPPADISPDLQDKADRSYFASFGSGSFSPNQYGGLTFSPSKGSNGGGGGGGDATSPSSIDPNTMLPKMMANPTGRQQIRNLQQLARAAKALKNVPEAMKQRILSHLLGIGYQDPQQASMQRALATAGYRSALGAPDRAARLQALRQGLQLRQQSELSREGDRDRARRMQAAGLELRAQGQAENRKDHLMRARASIDNRISSMTRALGAIPDQNSDAAIQLNKRLLQLHKQAGEFDKLMGAGKSDNGNGSDDSEGSVTPTGGQY
jgi:hypothetical protein